jgi:demethylmenaquinone methyltransferase / 2-methoxy-6-polyprenyl-1,4-benzoquinol methylase
MYLEENIHKLFDKIAKRYDFTTFCLSLGLDKKWRKTLSNYIPQHPSLNLLDIGTGTAEQLITIANAKSNIRLVGIDTSSKMLNIGKKKIQEKGLTNKITLIKSYCNDIPFPNQTFDYITMSFVLRNIINNFEDTLKEAIRLLKPNGKILILEFSKPSSPLIENLYEIYAKYLIPILGGILSGNTVAYKYLYQSIKKLTAEKDLEKLFDNLNIKNVKKFPMNGGITTLYDISCN